MAQQTEDLKSAGSEKTNSEKSKIEIVCAIVLSVAALSAAWCGYQSALWSGIQTFSLADYTSKNRQAQERNIIMTQRRAVDADMTMNFINAYAEGNEKKLNFYLSRTRPEMKKIFSTWMEHDKNNDPSNPPHPLAMAEYNDIYKNLTDSIAELRTQANDLYDRANSANSNSDNYILLTVFFSAVLFLGGLSTQLISIKAKKILVGMSSVLCFFSILYLVLKMPFTGGH
jgi:hypothetical protein